MGLPPTRSEPLPSPPLEPASLPEKVIQAFLLAVVVIGAVLAKFAGPVWLNFMGLVILGVAFAGLWCVGWVRKGGRAHV